jgi:DNA polymerase alpha-associated DNA helicase A
MSKVNENLSKKFLSALNVERREDYDSTQAIISSTPPKILAKNGLAVLNLVIENIRTSLGGKLIVELSIDSAIIGSKETATNSNKKNKTSKSKNPKTKSTSTPNTNPLANNDFKTGDIVRIDKYLSNPTKINKKLQNSSRKEDHENIEIQQVSIEGVVTSSNNFRICVALSDTGNNQSSVADRVWDLQSTSQRLWIVKISNEITYRRMESTLRKLSEFSIDTISSNQEYAPPIVQYLLGIKEYISPSNTELSNVIGKDGLNFYNHNLNESQKKAIEFALVSPLTIIHGPPGTGKTSTLIEYIIQHLKIYPTKRILITAPSNIAADTIIERLSNHFNGDDSKLVRIGHPARILQSTRKHSLDFLVSQNDGAELDDLQNDLSKLEKEVRKSRISKQYSDRKEIWREIKLLNKEFKERSKKGVRDVLLGSKVVVSTLHGSGSWEIVANLYNYDKDNTSNIKGFGKGFFHTVIIDEVSQALEPSCWIPIINHGPDRLVLAGDNKQLPPTIHVSDRPDQFGDLERGTVNKQAYKVLSQSLFDRIVRLYGGNEQDISFIKFLDTQYRMCEKCMIFPSYEWYNGKLKAADSVKDCKVIDLIKQHQLALSQGSDECFKHSKRSERKKRSDSTEEISNNIQSLNLDDIEESSDLLEQVIWYDTQGGLCPESIEVSEDNIGRILGIGGSKYNIGECYVVQKHVNILIKLGVKEEDIGIIAPYSAQVSRLRSLIWTGRLVGEDGEEEERGDETSNSDNIYPKIEINTVDGFQGREKEIIILSLVRSNFGDYGDSKTSNKWDSSDVGFLSDFRRLNVSITRCKKQLVVVGDMETLEQSGIVMLKDWCNWCSENANIRYLDL